MTIFGGKRRGFTLMEIIISIALLAILSGIFTISMSSGTDSAEASRILGELDALKSAASLYYADNVSDLPTPAIADLKDYVSAPEKLDNSEYKFVEGSNTSQWFVGYDISGASSGVRSKLASSAESHGLRSGTEDSDTDVYDGGTSGVYVRVK